MRCGWPSATSSSPSRRPDVAVGRGEAVADVLGDVDRVQPRQLDRAGLPEEGAPAVGEQLSHHPDVRAGEDIARGVAVVLDLRADRGVQPLAGAQHVLELVEDDERASAVALVQAPGQREPVEQRRLGLGVDRDLHPGGDGAPARPERRAQHAPNPAEPRREASLELVGVGQLDPLGDVRRRQRPEEVDVDRRPALGPRVGHHAAQQRGLPVPAGRHQPAVVTAHGPLEQRRCLGLAVEQVLRRHGLAVAERVHAICS